MNKKNRPAALQIESLAFSYREQATLRHISFEVSRGEVACLIGPSGCGKSTLLRLIAGFEQPQSGHIRLNGQLLSDPEHVVPPQQRGVGMLFQDLALFPHMTVEQNIAYGLAAGNQSRVDELLALCRLDSFKTRYPHQLSGGQQQRVALARTMAPKPDLILLDEPFSSVDADMQSNMACEIREVLVQDQATALWVTHSLSEACAVADHVGLILGGELKQFDYPQTLCEQPETTEVAQFINHGNVMRAKYLGSNQAKTALGMVYLNNTMTIKEGGEMSVLMRPDDLLIEPDESEGHCIQRCVYQGGHHLLDVRLSHGERVQVFSAKAHELNQKVAVSFRSAQKPVWGMSI